MFEHSDSLVFPALTQRNLESGRVYQVLTGPQAGHVYPSITRVLNSKPKPELEAWKLRVGAAEASIQSSRATARGNSLHSLFECYLKNDTLPSYSPVVGELWSRLRPALDAHVGVVYAQEQDVYSDHLSVAGRMDLLAEWDGVLSIIDLKNSKSTKKEEWESVQSYFVQGTFYALAVYERTGAKVRQVVVPIVSPETIQIFIQPITKYYEALVTTIDEFYTSYEKELDSVAAV